jgi:radical SAM superfamily enzyme
MMTEEYIEACQRLQGGGASVVLEFGLQTSSREEARAIRRPNNLAKVERWAGALCSAGVPFEVSLIYGLPMQTLGSFEGSVAFARSLGAARVVAWPLMLLRGTQLEKDRHLYGLQEEVSR